MEYTGKRTTLADASNSRERMAQKVIDRHVRDVQTPITTRTFDFIITELITIIGTQICKDFLDGTPLYGSVVKKENWVNGIKYQSEQGLFTVTNFDKNVSLADFNPAENENAPKIHKVTRRKKVNIKIRADIVYSIALDAKALVNWLEIRIKKLMDTFKIHFFREVAKVITKSDGAELAITYDKTLTHKIDTDTNTKKMLRDIREQLVSFKTPSNTHTLFGTTHESFVYSYDPSEFTLILDKSVYGARGDLLSTVFNKDEILTNVEKEYIDFSLTKISGTETTDILGFLVHKSCIKLGFQLADKVWEFNVPNYAQVKEVHNWYGFSRWDGAPIIKLKKGA